VQQDLRVGAALDDKTWAILSNLDMRRWRQSMDEVSAIA